MTSRKIDAALNLIIATADRYGGLVPSMLDRRTGAMITENIPGPIAGQRQHDRAPRGSNLMHDVPLVELMYERSGRYADAADRYLRCFATHCTDTPSGLFPWGEHAFWDLLEDRLGNSQAWANRNISRGAYHDHLREAPVWLWDKLYKFNPRCVERFADGLRYHWKSGALAHEYFRHAYIGHHEVPLPHEAISRDFARHGGFYILDWSYAYVKFGRDDFRANLVRMLDYWWNHRHTSGLLAQHSRVENRDESQKLLSLGQTLSLAVSLLGAAEVLESAGALPEQSRTMRERAGVYLNGCLQAPHDLNRSKFVAMVHPVSGEPAVHFVPWGTRYGGSTSVAGPVLMMLRAYEFTRDRRCLDWAAHAGRWLAEVPIPVEEQVHARDPGHALNVLLKLHELTDGSAWLDRARTLGSSVDALYFDTPLPRGASAIDWYEGQLGSGELLLAMDRLAAHSAS